MDSSTRTFATVSSSIWVQLAIRRVLARCRNRRHNSCFPCVNRRVAGSSPAQAANHINQEHPALEILGHHAVGGDLVGGGGNVAGATPPRSITSSTTGKPRTARSRSTCAVGPTSRTRPRTRARSTWPAMKSRSASLARRDAAAHWRDGKSSSPSAPVHDQVERRVKLPLLLLTPAPSHP
jgi:hypothetical protein